MRIIPEDQRKKLEEDYLAWFFKEIEKMTQNHVVSVCEENSVAVALEIFDFAVLSFRETGNIEELKEMTRYVFKKIKEVTNDFASDACLPSKSPKAVKIADSSVQSYLKSISPKIEEELTFKC